MKEFEIMKGPLEVDKSITSKEIVGHYFIAKPI